MKNISNYLGAFIDLLGQSERLSEYDIMPPKADERFIQYIKSTYGRVRLFREGFIQYCRKAIKELVYLY